MTHGPYRWYQFSIRTLLVLMLIVGCVLGPIVYERQRLAKQRAAAGQISGWGATTYGGKPRSPGMRWVFGEDTLCHITAVQVGSNASFADVDLGLLVQFPEITKVWLIHEQLTDTSLIQIADLRQLHELRLGSSQITDAGLVHLEGLTNLQSLHLWDTQVSSAGVTELQSKLPNLHIVREKRAR